MFIFIHFIHIEIETWIISLQPKSTWSRRITYYRRTCIISIDFLLFIPVKITFYSSFSACGNVPSSFDCYLVNRGVKTLHVRMEQHMKSATLVAQYLQSHPKVLKVHYMGFPDHPQRDIIERQFTGYTGLVSFYVNGGLKESTKLLESLKLFYITVSFGCFESLAALPWVRPSFG